MQPALNLKETIISSVFVHLILFLLMLAASHYTTGFPGGIQKIISVDLAREGGDDQPTPVIDSTDRSGIAPMPDQAVSSPEPASEQRLSSEMRPEPAADAKKMQKPERPLIEKEGVSSMEAYYQYIAVHKKVYGQQTGIRINNLLGPALEANTREFYGGGATVNLTFGADGSLIEVRINASSQPLKEFLEEIDWGAIPPPVIYSLGYTRVQIVFGIQEGYMNFNVNVL